MGWRSLAIGAGFLAAGGAMAQDAVDGDDARGQLFHESRAEVVLFQHDFLSEREQQILREIGAANVPYYGAIAVSPDDGLATEATTARGNYHDAASAGAAVLADCNAKRTGSAPCVVVAEIRPRGWEARRLQLSAGATADFRSEYRRGRGEKALATSVSTGAFGIGKGAGAAASALAACRSAGGADDCQVVIAD